MSAEDLGDTEDLGVRLHIDLMMWSIVGRRRAMTAGHISQLQW
jgi:hypothetical protein